VFLFVVCDIRHGLIKIRNKQVFQSRDSNYYKQKEEIMNKENTVGALTHENYLTKYKDVYWTLKNQDNCYNLVNHNMYLFLRKGTENNKEKVTVSLYTSQPRLDETNHTSDNQRLLLTMTQGKESTFKNRIKKLLDKDIDFFSSTSDDGGSVIFMEEDLDSVAEVFKIKHKVKKVLTEEQRQELSERAKKAFSK